MQEEAESEVAALREQFAVSRRTEEDVTLQMALDVQYMLRQFGVPYITGPMEAEAQCAELVRLNLCDGIITDDSDVFLFGGERVFKNMFNDNKTVQCFVTGDLARNVGLDRHKLIRLAYLLGSDYTDGLEGVGVVLAMEILSVFPGEHGLRDFRDWWLKAQQGLDKAYLPPGDWDDEEKRQIRQRLGRIKKSLVKKVHLSGEWPDQHVELAYLEPQVDSSGEPFAWGLPDLEQVRKCLMHFLGWSVEKVDQYVVPVLEQMMRRGRNVGGQTRLDTGFFDNTVGHGAYAPRERVKFGSSRLQQVINGFRAAEKDKQTRESGPQEIEVSDSDEEAIDKTKDAPKSAAKRKRTTAAPRAKRGGAAGRGNRGGRGASTSSTRGKGKKGAKKARAAADEGEAQQEEGGEAQGAEEQEKSDSGSNYSEQEQVSRKRPRPRPRPTSFSNKRGAGPGNLELARNMSFDDLSILPESRAAQISPDRFSPERQASR